jgi:8-oxo-dGTP pyrophosphatase MutT (NUDIX family)
VDFGNFPPLKLPAASVGTGAIIYRMAGGRVEILTASRAIEPWKGSVTVAFGGYIDPDDVNPKTAVVREVKEETGLDVALGFLIGIYGPERYHYVLRGDPFRAEKTAEPGNIRPTVVFYFMATPVDGTLRESDEESGFIWRRPEELVGMTVGFDCARALIEGLIALRGDAPRFPLGSIS